MKICPHCAEEIQDAAKVCKHCQRDLTGKAPPVVKVRQADFVSTIAKWAVGGMILLFFYGMLRVLTG